MKFFIKFSRKVFYVCNNFLTLVCSESYYTKEKTGFNIFYILSPINIISSYDVVCESIRIHELKLIEDIKSKSQYLEVKEFLDEKNK